MANYLSPQEITDYTSQGGVNKVNRSVALVFAMAIMAGVYIALGGFASSVAAHDIANKGVAKLVTGAVFPIGLMFVVINGADLFTGNCLIVIPTLEKKTSWAGFCKNLIVVLLGNFVGAFVIAFLVAHSGILDMSDGRLGAYAIKTATSKANLQFTQALCLAIICNIYVCAGIWMIYAAKDIAGKILAGFFSIFAFAISGAEHIVANMFYVPVALLAKSDNYLELAHVTSDQLTWGKFFINNVIPVTIGNIIGGVFIGGMYFVIYRKLTKPSGK